MDFIRNFNGLELVFIVVLAILLFGPEKIPDIAATLGTWARRIRKLSANFMAMLDEEAGFSEITQETSQISSSLNQTSLDVNLQPQTRTKQQGTDQVIEQDTSSSTSKKQSSKAELENQLFKLEQELQEIKAKLASQESEKASPGDD